MISAPPIPELFPEAINTEAMPESGFHAYARKPGVSPRIGVWIDLPWIVQVPV